MKTVSDKMMIRMLVLLIVIVYDKLLVRLHYFSKLLKAFAQCIYEPYRTPNLVNR